MVNLTNPINQSAGSKGHRPRPLQAGDFAGALGRVMQGADGPNRPLKAIDFVPGARAAADQHAELTRTAQKWVAQTFYGAMLKQMRNSPFKSSLFEGGRGGEAFGAMLDQTLADRMARGQNNKLVRSIVRQILKQNEHKEEAATRQHEPQPSHDGEAQNPFAKVRVHVAPAR